MRKKQGLIKAVVMLGLVMGLASVLPTAAFAEAVDAEVGEASIAQSNGEIVPFANTDNSPYRFNVASDGTNGTEYRQKQDDTSVYIWIQSWWGVPVRLYADGAINSSGWLNMDCTQGTYRSNHPGEWQMYNLVRENGRTWCRLTCWGERGSGGVEGEWSPDCYQCWNYGVLPS